MKKIKLILFCCVLLTSCDDFFELEKEIDLTGPDTETKLVVQGVIQAGYPAYVLLTKSSPYFSQVNSTTYQDIFVTDASVKVKKRNGLEVNLVNINEISTGVQQVDSILYFLKQQYPGFYVEWPFDIFNFKDLPYKDVIGDYGGRYDLEILWNNDTITSTTTIPQDYTVDSVWFELDPLAERDSLGNFWFRYSDPDTLGNTLMFETKRIAHLKEWVNPNDNNQVSVYNLIDPLYAKALWGFVRNDFEGANGNSFVSFFQRGNISTIISSEYDDLVYEDEERGYFKMGKSVNNHDFYIHPDTVLIRISQIDYKSYLFWRSVEYQQSSNGNPFAEPLNLQSNINGGYGVWYGQSSTYFKAIAKEGLVFTRENHRYYPFIDEIL